MSASIVLQLRAKHFIGAVFESGQRCPIANSAKEHFKIEDVSEGVTSLALYYNNHFIIYTHDHYGMIDYESDQVMAEGTDPDVVIREITLTPFN